MDGPTIIVSVLAFVLVGGYFVGGLLNRRRARQLVLALRTAFGEATNARLTWLSRSSFRLDLEAPLPRVNRLACTALLAPREALVIWVLWALQGRGDLLDFKANLAAVPPAAGLGFDPRHRLGRAARAAAVAAGGRVTDTATRGLQIAASDDGGRQLVERSLRLAIDAGDVVLLEIKARQPRLTLLLSVHGPAAASTAHLPAMLSGIVAEARATNSRGGG